MKAWFVLVLAGCPGAQVWPDVAPAAACDADGLPRGESLLRVEHVDGSRTALMWAPASAGPHDVVVDLHDFRAEPRRQAHYSLWIPHAAAIGAVLVAPDGKNATWNVGNECCGKAAEKGHADRELLDAMAARVDATACTSGRVLATGIGNGGMMAHRWACESDVVDAVVSVGGALQLEACENARPIPVVHYHGDRDEQYPVGGSAGYPDQGAARPTAHALAAWKARNRVVGEPVHTEQGALVCDRWEGAAPVVWCTVRGMVDVWPGSADVPADPAAPLSDATAGAWAEVIRPWWDANLPR